MLYSQQRPSQTPLNVEAVADMLSKAAKSLLKYSSMSQNDAEDHIYQVLDQAGQSIKSARTKIAKPYPRIETKHIQFFYDHNSDASLSHQDDSHIIDGYKRDEFNTEVRCFHIPAAIVHREYELIHKYKQHNISNLMHIFCTEMLDSIKQLENISEDKNTAAKQIYHINASLCNSLEFLDEICAIWAEFNLIYKRIV